MKNIDIYIVGAIGSGKSGIREHILAWFDPAIKDKKLNLHVHTVQCDPEKLGDVTFSDNPINWDDE